MFDPGEPYAIADLSRTLTRLTRDGKALCESLSVEAFFSPQGDRWSPAEHVRHLVKSSRPLVRAYRLPFWFTRLMFGTARRPSRTFVALRSEYREKLAAGGNAGRFAPSKEGLAADQSRRRAEILGEWQRVNESLASSWGRWRGMQLDQTLLPHPLMGKLTAREMAMFTVYHTSHHLNLFESRL